MGDLRRVEPQQRDLSEAPASTTNCRYCGAKLNAFVYFCSSCGTPYKDLASVVTSAAPAPLGEGERIQLKAPQAKPLFFTYLAVVLFVGIFTELFFEEQRLDLAIFLQTAAVFVTTCVFATIHHRSLLAQLKQFGFDRWEAWAGLGALVPLLVINFTYHQFLVRGLGVESMTFNELREAGIGSVVLVLAFCVFPAISEEFAFRGLLQHWLHAAIKPMRALVLASFLFAVLHFSIFSLPYLFGVGMVLGWTKWKTGSLYPAMLIHFLHNLAVVQLFETLM